MISIYLSINIILCSSQISIIPKVPLHIQSSNTSFLYPIYNRDANLSGITFNVKVSDLGISAAFYINIYKFSRVASSSEVANWLYEGGIPRSYPFPFSLMFHQLFGGRPPLDNNGDACMGYFHKAEICLQLSECILVPTFFDRDIFVPINWAGEYILEAFVSNNIHSTCSSHNVLLPLYSSSPISMVEDRGPLLIPGATYFSLNISFEMKYAEEVSAWWGLNYQLKSVGSWMEFMKFAVQNALPLIQNGGQVLEFGVASGKSLTFLAQILPTVPIIGFDSFKGLPIEWGRYAPNLFNMFGTPPMILFRFNNIDLKIGYFNTTLPLVDRTRGIGLLHIDSDLFESAEEVFLSLSCLLVPGSVVVFDEWFNMKGSYGEDKRPWYREGEFLAFFEVSEKNKIEWEPLGIYFEQAFALRVSKMSEEDWKCSDQEATAEIKKETSMVEEREEFLQSMRQVANVIMRTYPDDTRVADKVNKIEACQNRDQALGLVRDLVALNSQDSY